MSKFLGSLILLLLCASLTGVQAQEKTVGWYVNTGWEAYRNGDSEKAIKLLVTADSLRPSIPFLLRYLSIVSIDLGDFDRTIDYLDQLSLLNADIEFLEHEAFADIKDEPAFQQISKKFTDINKLVTVSDTAFTLTDKLIHPQGIAFDPSSGSFLVSSIHKGKVVRKRGRQPESDFVTKRLWAASGMAADVQNRWLWIGTGGTNRWIGYDEMLHQNKSKVIKVDLQTGAFLEEFFSFEDGPHFFGDLVVQPESDHVYVADARSPSLYMIDPDNQRLNLVQRFDNLESLRSVTFSSDGKYLFFSDFRYGLFRFSMDSGETISIPAIDGIGFKAIDGAYFYNNSLILIQRQVRPRRITKCELNEDLSAITACTYLEKANPILNEPTQGILVGDVFYYVANSSWRRYGQGGIIAAEDEHPVPLVMKINLKDH